MKKRWKLIWQVTLVFTITTIIIAGAFILIFELSLVKVYKDQNKRQLRQYLLSIERNLDRGMPTQSDKLNGHIVYFWRDDGAGEVSLDFNMPKTDYIDTSDNPIENKDFILDKTREKVDLYLEDINEYTNKVIEFTEKDNKETFYFVSEITKPEEAGGYIAFGFNDNRYAKAIKDDFAKTLRWTVVGLIILGNLSILIWARLVVGRIDHLRNQIKDLNKTNYEVPIIVEGNDEITDLSNAVEDMRKELLENEQTKREIMQNISHDFKTPISVIKTYGEAIKDGISTIDEVDVIIKQADILNHKVVQLLQLNKLTYLTNDQELKEIKVKDVINDIVNKNKYKFDKKFELKLDNSTYYATYDNLEVAIGNIIDNAMRYAKTRIVIVLKNKKLTIYNDGEHIDEEFMEKIFKPYEKGSKGEFGLGMSITQQTLAFFKLSVSVRNVKNGVMFVIEPI